MITILYFANVRTIVGKSREVLEEHPTTIRELLTLLSLRNKALTEPLKVCAVSLNEEYCTLDAAIKNGDVVGIIPPVSGG